MQASSQHLLSRVLDQRLHLNQRTGATRVDLVQFQVAIDTITSSFRLTMLLVGFDYVAATQTSRSAGRTFLNDRPGEEERK